MQWPQHYGTVIYETYIAGQKNLNVYFTFKIFTTLATNGVRAAPATTMYGDHCTDYAVKALGLPLTYNVHQRWHVALQPCPDLGHSPNPIGSIGLHVGLGESMQFEQFKKEIINSKKERFCAKSHILCKKEIFSTGSKECCAKLKLSGKN